MSRELMSLQAMPSLENNFWSHPIWSTLHGLGPGNGCLDKKKKKKNRLKKISNRRSLTKVKQYK